MTPSLLKIEENKINESIDFLAKEHFSNPDIAPIFDGLCSPEKYLFSSCRVLWILKEPYDDFDQNGNPSGGGWSLVKDLFEKKPLDFASGKTGSIVTYISYGILNDSSWNDIHDIYTQPSIANCLQSIAYINLSKMPAYTTTQDNKLWGKYKLWKDVLIKQIYLYEPEVIIFGNTFRYFKEDIITDKTIIPENEGFSNFYRLTDKLVIDAYHPGNRFSSSDLEIYAETIIKKVRAWKAEPHIIEKQSLKYLFIAKLAKFLADNSMQITAKSLADILKNNGIKTQYGEDYSGGRGTYTFIKHAWKYFDDNNDGKIAKYIADAYVMPNGAHAWD